MLAAKVERKSWTDRVQLIEGDSADLPFILNLPHRYPESGFEKLEVGLTEMHRTLKHGGMGVVLSFQFTVFPLKQIFHFISTPSCQGLGYVERCGRVQLFARKREPFRRGRIHKSCRRDYRQCQCTA